MEELVIIFALVFLSFLPLMLQTAFFELINYDVKYLNLTKLEENLKYNTVTIVTMTLLLLYYIGALLISTKIE